MGPPVFKMCVAVESAIKHGSPVARYSARHKEQLLTTHFKLFYAQKHPRYGSQPWVHGEFATHGSWRDKHPRHRGSPVKEGGIPS